MTLQIADALDEAHGLGIIHRDIKTANLILEANGRVKILDFGLAKFTGPAVELGRAETMAQTSLGIVVGTVSYMSPEQALSRAVDTRSGLFSLGIVVYESLTGRLPFDGEATTAIVDALVHAEPPPLSRLNYEVPPRLEDAVRKLLQKDPMRGISRHANCWSISGRSGRTSSAGWNRGRARWHPVWPWVRARPRHHPRPTRWRSSRSPTSPGSRPTTGSGPASPRRSPPTLKSIKELSLIGRERVFDALRVTVLERQRHTLDERMVIEVGRQLRAHTGW